MKINKLFTLAFVLLMSVATIACANSAKSDASAKLESTAQDENDYTNQVKSFFEDCVYGPEKIDSKMFADELNRKLKIEYAEWVDNDPRFSSVYNVAFGVDDRYDYEVKDVAKLNNGWYKVTIEGCYMGYGGNGSVEKQITYVKVAPNAQGNGFVIIDLCGEEDYANHNGDEVIVDNAAVASVKDLCTSAFISDSDGPVTNIRATPKGKIIATIPTDYEVELYITSPVNGWWKIVDGTLYDPEDVEGYIKEGYIHYSCLMQDTRNYDGHTIYLREQPRADSKVVGGLRETVVRPIDISSDGEWVKVIEVDTGKKGWIEKDWLCGNPVTNCC